MIIISNEDTVGDDFLKELEGEGLPLCVVAKF